MIEVFCGCSPDAPDTEAFFSYTHEKEDALDLDEARDDVPWFSHSRNSRKISDGSIPETVSPTRRRGCSLPHFRKHHSGDSPGRLHTMPAHSFLAKALASDGRVDFCTVTEICESAFGNALETAAVVKLLTTALHSESEDGADLPRQLKALTVANEMLYDALSRQAMLAEPGLVPALRNIRLSPAANQEGPAAECVRMLSTELIHRLRVEPFFFL